MPTPTKGPRLGGGPAHERLILANLATALFEHDRITTTEAKARRLRPFAERLITFAKRGDLHARRKVLTIVRDMGVVHRLFTEIAPDVAQRPGGYTRITKIGPRKGDNAPMAVIELIREPFSPKQATVKEAEAATARASKPAAAPAPAEPAQAEPVTEEAVTEEAVTEEAVQAEAVSEEVVEAEVVEDATVVDAPEAAADDAPESAPDEAPESDGAAPDPAEVEVAAEEKAEQGDAQDKA